MARPSTLEVTTYLTTTGVMKRLKMARPQIKKRLKSGVFPPPTKTNPHGVRLFDEDWMVRALLIVACEKGTITPFELRHQLDMLNVNLSAEVNDGG